MAKSDKTKEEQPPQPKPTDLVVCAPVVINGKSMGQALEDVDKTRLAALKEAGHVSTRAEFEAESKKVAEFAKKERKRQKEEAAEKLKESAKKRADLAEKRRAARKG